MNPPVGALATALRPAAWMYGVAVAARNRKFDRGAGVVKLRVPVVSVGNITVGGTGKSPVVRWIASLLQREGVKPVIAMRGYGATRGERSDEQLEHEELLPGVDVLAQPDRVAAITPYLAQHADAGCVILDDGFQHRRIARDLDIVLIDARQPGLDGALLPAGRLREPVRSLRRASAVFVTRAERMDDRLAARITALHGKPPAAWLRHVWSRMRIYSAGSGASTLESLGWLRGKRVAVMAGVGLPASFAEQVQAAGAAVQRHVPVRDHQRYSASMLAGLANEMSEFEALVTTLKDWVKMRGVIDLQRWTVPIVVPELAIEAMQGEDAVIAMLEAVTRRGPAGTHDHPARTT